MCIVMKLSKTSENYCKTTGMVPKLLNLENEKSLAVWFVFIYGDLLFTQIVYFCPQHFNERYMTYTYSQIYSVSRPDLQFGSLASSDIV